MIKPKILWLSDSTLTTTGFATISWNILNRLKDEFECHALGHNMIGQTLKPGVIFEDNTKLDFYLHGTGGAKYSMNNISNKIRKYDIDIFGGLLDTFMLYEAGFMQIDTSPAKTFFYYPSDGGGCLPRYCENILQKIEVPIAMSKFARDQVHKIYGIKSEYIPHAYDTKCFYPLSSTKKEVLRDKWQLRDKFVVGVVARNQGRKMLDRTIKAFSIFCKDRPDAILLMHTDPMDMAQVFDINTLIRRFNITNRVLFTGTSLFDPFTYKQMNEVYNLMDVFLLTTSGEGFGVPIVEAMGVGIPQLVTDYTTTKELVIDEIKTGESIKLVGETEECPYPHTNEVLDGTTTGSWDVERGFCSIYDCADKLNLMYDKWKTSNLNIYIKNSLTKAKKYYTWEAVMPSWKKLLWRLYEK